MKQFLDEQFLLRNKTAERLYHEYAAPMPIIDYHNHLPPDQIAADHSFDNITQVWLYGDHYKWRAMRSNGVAEKYCTGDASDFEKFEQWAATVPATLRNPLYHWTHLELQRYFEIYELLNRNSARKIYDSASLMLKQPDYSVRSLLTRMNVKQLCTTDDPVDNLEFHRAMQNEDMGFRVAPAFRPDKAMQVRDAPLFQQYIAKLEAAANVSISNWNKYMDALKSRHDYFDRMGCCVSDHGLEQLYAEDFSEAVMQSIFAKLIAGNQISPEEEKIFQSGMLYYFGIWDWEKGWVQQYHLGALRNTNTRMLQRLGADTGWDSIGDFSQARALAKFLDRLDREEKLSKTIIYNLNPADNEVMATMLGNFNDGSTAGKIQWGSAWWFLDQLQGMTAQLNILSNMGLLSRFVGMLTDSRSFLSFPRHEYFRRLLCNLLGTEIENGEIPNDLALVGGMVQDICYNNASNFFDWEKKSVTAVAREKMIL